MDPNHNPPSEREWTISEMEEFFTSMDALHFKPMGIFITSIVPPEQGWLIAMYCPKCKETTFMLSLFAAKPKDGDYFRINNLCASEEVGARHNIEMATTTVPWNRFDFGPYDLIIEQEIAIEEAKKRYPNTLIGG